jgi:subfamily B ATP-binding cassette protein MsbA
MHFPDRSLKSQKWITEVQHSPQTGNPEHATGSVLYRLLPAAKYLGPLVKSEPQLLARFAATALGRSGLSVVTIFLIQNTLAGLLGEGNDVARWMVDSVGKTTSIAVAVALLLASNIGSVWCRYNNQVVQQRLIKAFELGLMDRLTRHLLRFSALFFQKQSPGDLLQTMRQDIAWLRLSLGAVATVVLDGILVGGLVVTVICLSPWLSFWALCVMPAAALPVVYVAKRVRLRSYTVRKTGYAFFDFVLEIILGIRMIKAYQAEEREAQITLDKAERYFDETIEQIRLAALGNGLMELVTGIGLVLVIMVGSVQIVSGTLLWADLFAFLLALRGINGPLNNVYTSFLEIQRSKASVDRISELLETPPDLPEPAEGAPLISAPRTITLEGVSFSYGETPVLKNVEFEVTAGEAVAVVGPSGAGKSTLLNLLTRFCDPTAGRVLYDGRDIREFRLADVYSMVALVAQDPFLFAATVRENIRAGRPNATDAEVEAAAKAAFVEDEILALPEGYETVLGIGGRTLSRGQSQRINLARAFLKDAPILLLDEATSSLDAIAEQQVQRAVNRLMEGRTSFFVTHRLSSLEHADRIILVEDNRCAAIGSHAELHRDSETYREMCRIQQLVDVLPA